MIDIVVVGAGFSGIYSLYRLREMGFRVRVIEAGGDVGGTWYWNRYPGARCDVESVEYCYSFSDELAQDWVWSERFATQPEILSYVRHVVERFDLRRDISFDTRVLAVHYDDDRGLWRISTDKDEQIEARFCVLATGCLSIPNLPEIPGIESFAGTVYHTAQWPHESVDFTGRRVGIIGTGSSGCQAIPLIAPQAAELYVFQRTANHCVPAGNHPLTQSYRDRIKTRYKDLFARWRTSVSGTNFPTFDRSAFEVSDQERELTYEYRWQAGGLSFLTTFNDLLVDQAANDTAAEFVRSKIRAVVKDPAVAERLQPGSHPIGAKRLCVVTGYYEAFNRPNVHLISTPETPIVAITPEGVRTTEGDIAIDDLIFATGFDAMTGALLAMDIVGRDGRSLRSEWADGPRTYLGLMMAGFPNLFVITGPGSPSVISNVLASIEQHVDWIAAGLGHMRAEGYQKVEVDDTVQSRWMDYCDQIAGMTLYPKGNSWYSGDNISDKPKKVTPFVGGFANYSAELKRITDNDYAGFQFARSA